MPEMAPAVFIRLSKIPSSNAGNSEAAAQAEGKSNNLGNKPKWKDAKVTGDHNSNGGA